MKHFLVAGSLVLLAATPGLDPSAPDAPAPRQPGPPPVTTPDQPAETVG